MTDSKKKSNSKESKLAKLPTKENFSEWYHELLMTAEIVDNRYPGQGHVRLVFPSALGLQKNVYAIIRELLDPRSSGDPVSPHDTGECVHEEASNQGLRG